MMKNFSKREEKGNHVFTIFLILLFLDLVSAIGCEAQSHIRGSVVNKANLPIANASVSLLQEKDSSLVKTTFSADDGSFTFQNIPNGNYLVSSSSIGYQLIYSSAISCLQNVQIDIGKLTLNESAAQLGSVIVTGRKSTFESKPDRTVINLRNSVTSSGSSALEVLERSPGVTINRQSNTISMEGKEGVMLMINGKVNYVPGDALIETLQGIQADNIEKIELITTPPASVDASGHAGLINIVMKSNNSQGVNGSFSAGVGYGHGFVDDFGFNINYRKQKINLYGNFSYSRVTKPLPIYLTTKLSDQGVVIQNEMSSDRVESNRALNGRAGLDYQISKSTVMGLMISGYGTKYIQNETVTNLVSSNSQLDTTIKTKTKEVKPWQNFSVNLNLQHQFSKDAKISANLDYIYYKNTEPFDYHTFYYDPAGNFLFDQIKRTNKLTPIHFWIAAVDYSKKLGKNLTIELGVKRTQADLSNDFEVERYTQGQWITDSSMTTIHHLSENYSAVYASLQWVMGKNTHVNLGARYEYTNYNLGTPGLKDLYDKHYGNLFPVFMFTHALNAQSSFSLSYNSRIARPSFNLLAPYAYFINENTLFTGNPALQPSISHTIAFDYNFRKYSFSISATKETNPIWMFQPTIDSTAHTVLLTPQNMKDQKLLSASISVPLEVNSWWSMQYNLIGSWQEVTSSGKSPLTQDQFELNVHILETFKLGNSFSMELSGFYQSPQIAGINVQEAYGSLDFGLRKKLPGKQGVLSFAATNILNTQAYAYTSHLPDKNQSTYSKINFVQPTVRLTYSRNFGNEKLKGKREYDTGADEVRN
ncbi:MAG TPA: outer membrane beta-barrel family protein, partial [Puia sp.]|nr:outer membrane beta-barrel family protein [Puia sp.]